MKVTVLLFGPERSALGASSAIVEVSVDASAREVLAKLAAQHPTLAASVRTARLAVNGQFASPDRCIHERDECALIGLVSGG